MIKILLFCMLVGVGAMQWHVFKEQFGKSYHIGEEHRQRIFEQNVAKIELHNSNPNNTYTMAVNGFADLTWDEFRMQYLSNFTHLNRTSSHQVSNSNTSVPEKKDWRGIVTDVKNQGNCGSCWSFAAVGGIESLYAIRTGQIMNFSDQQVLDCTSVGSCAGGYMESAYAFVLENGICAESEYGYVGYDDVCRNCTKVFHIAGFDSVQSEEKLVVAVARQPITVAIEANQNLQFYSSGIYDDPDCNNINAINHGVLVVGYDSQSSGLSFGKNDYWIIKNSWGVGWGERGYFRMRRNFGEYGMCAVAAYGTYAY